MQEKFQQQGPADIALAQRIVQHQSKGQNAAEISPSQLPMETDRDQTHCALGCVQVVANREGAGRVPHSERTR